VRRRLLRAFTPACSVAGALQKKVRMSVISSTDVECFRRLSNPEVVDLTTNAATSRQIAQQMREAMEKAVAMTPKADDDSDDESKTEEPPPLPRQSSSLSSAISALRTSARPAESSLGGSSSAGKSAAVPASLPVKEPETPKPPLPRIAEEGSSDDEDPPAPTPPSASSKPAGPKDPETLRLEKQGFLLELHALQSKGVKLTRDFSMADSLNELEFELQKQTSMQNTTSAVQNMKDVLRLGLNGVELANAKLGPFLCIEGWAESITGDMKRFDAPLEKLYKRYWRKASMSPIMELGMIILGSLAMHHFKTKMFGRIASPPREEPAYRQSAGGRGAASNQAAPVQTGRPRKGPPVQAAAAPQGDPRTRRPVLRSPTSLLGI